MDLAGARANGAVDALQVFAGHAALERRVARPSRQAAVQPHDLRGRLGNALEQLRGVHLVDGGLVSHRLALGLKPHEALGEPHAGGELDLELG